MRFRVRVPICRSPAVVSWAPAHAQKPSSAAARQKAADSFGGSVGGVLSGVLSGLLCGSLAAGLLLSLRTSAAPPAMRAKRSDVIEAGESAAPSAA